jgi:polyisoprenoid-binding protein YceI
MNKTITLAVISLFWATQLHAQAAAPTPKPATPTMAQTPTAKPATGTTPVAPAAAKPTAPPSAVATSPTSPAAAAAAPKPADKGSVDWVLDAGHSQIGFTARHLGFSKASGMFKKFTASIKADPKTAKISTLEATAETASIDTGIEKRDAHLRSDDFLNAEKFPQLKLVTKSIKWNGNKFTAKSDLTIRDITKEVSFSGELLGVHLVNFGQGPQLRAAYEATTTISRKEFGLKWNTITEGLSVVADPVKIDLAIEMSYNAPAATVATAPATK